MSFPNFFFSMYQHATDNTHCTLSGGKIVLPFEFELLVWRTKLLARTVQKQECVRLEP